MKILWLSHLVPYPPKGGVLQRSYNLVRETCKHHELTLLAFIQKDLLKDRFSSIDAGLEEARIHLGEFCDHIEFVDIPCDRTRSGKHILALKSLFSRDPYTINWLKSDAMLSAIQNIRKQSDIDLVHFDTISLAPYISEFPDLPKALDHHNIESHMMLRRAELETNLLKRLYFYQEGKKLIRYEKNICPEFDLHITCSGLDSDRLSNVSKLLNIKVIPNGVDIDYFFPRPEFSRSSHLIFAGSLDWYPNIDAMLFFSREIWPLLKRKSPEMIMHVVGNSPPSELLALAENDDHFQVHGFVDDVREYISRASIYVCPIRDGGGTKLKLLDAFAMGMATIAHPVSCEGLDTTDGYNVVLAETAEQFANRIIELSNKPDLRRELGHNARRTAVEKYAFTKIGEELSALYQAAAANNTRK